MFLGGLKPAKHSARVVRVIRRNLMPVNLIPDQLLRHARADGKSIPFVNHRLAPEFIRLGFEQVIGIHVGEEPGAIGHFVGQLAFRPTGIANKKRMFSGKMSWVWIRNLSFSKSPPQ